MGERQDFIALDWVAGEIEETLKQASQALEAYIANRDDATKLRFCLTHIHQVHGTLQMVEFFGAALLAQEMEGMAHALAQGKIHDSHVDDALAVLKNAIAQLPKYLQKVKESRHGLPATLLPVLNDLRAVRGESLLSETVLFTPDMSASQSAATGEAMLKGNELAEVAHKLRQMYQIALLGIIRGKEVRKNLNYLAKVCARLAKVSAGCPSQSLWRVCIAVLEGLLNGSIESSVAVKILLRQIDRQIKQIIDEGEAALARPAPEQLLKNLLYYVARSKANSKFIKEIQAEFHLDESLLGDGELDDETLAAPTNSTVSAVVSALAKEIADIQAELQDAGTDTAKLAEVLPMFRRVNDTMAILGLGKTLKLVQEPYSQLARLLATQDQLQSADVDAIAQQLAKAEAELNPGSLVQAEAQPAFFNDSEEAQEQLDNAFLSVLRESRIGLEQTKEAIIEFVATQWDQNCLSDVPELLKEIRGSLNMVPLTQAAQVIDACDRYVRNELLTSDPQVPEWQMLDTLADAITSIDYYLERLIDDADADIAPILDVAAESVAELGYPISEAGATDNSDADSNALSEPEIPVLDEPHDTAAESTEQEASSQEPPPFDEIHLEEDDQPEVPVLAEVIPFQAKAPEVDTAFPDMEDPLEEPVAEDFTAAPGDEAAIEPEPPTLEVDDVEEKSIEPPPVTDLNTAETATDTEAVSDSAPEDDEDYDPEIVEIFIEEAGEVLETINEFLPQWLADSSNDEARAEVRRAYHTLKGSGRMVGATDIGELAWSVENMLNRVLDNSVSMDQPRFDLVQEVTAYVPTMVTAFEQRNANGFDKAYVANLIANAELLAKEQNPTLLTSAEVAATDDGAIAESAEISETIDTAIDTTESLESSEFVDSSDSIDNLEPATDDPAEEISTLEDTIDTAAFAADDLPVLDEVADAVLEADETDSELLDIFITEAKTHGLVLKQFIIHCKEMDEPVELSDDLQRALHTLKGSANMAGVKPVADVVTHIELLVKELRAVQLRADTAVVELLEEGYNLIKRGIEQLRTEPQAPLTGVDDYERRLKFLLEERLAEVSVPQLEEPGIAPEALNQFLARSLDCISMVSDQLQAARDGQTMADFPAMEQLVAQFIDEAESVNMVPLVELGESMEVLYRDASHAPADAIGDDFYNLAGAGNDALIDMLDQIAGQQSPVCDQQLLATIQDFEFTDPAASAPTISEQAPVDIDASSITAGDSYEDFDLSSITVDDDIVLDANDFEKTLQMPAVSEPPLLGDDDVEEAIADDEPVDLDFDSIIADSESDTAQQAEDENITAAMSDFVDAVADDANAELSDNSDGAATFAEPSPDFEIETPDLSFDDEPASPSFDAEPPVLQEPLVEEPAQAEPPVLEPATPFAASADSDDDIDDEIVEIFLEEADDLIEGIDESIHAWSDERTNREHLDDLLRILHTLKGGARLAGLTEMGNLSHNFETRLINFDNSRAELTDDILGEVQVYQDQLMAQLQAIKAGEKLEAVAELHEPEPEQPVEPEASAEETRVELEEPTVEAPTEESFSFDLDEEETSETPDVVDAPAVVEKTAEVVPFNRNQPREVSAEKVSSPAFDTGNKKGPQEVIKVSAQLLEDLVNLAGETSISRGRAEEQISELVFALDEMQITVDRLQEQVRRLDMETEAQILYRQEQVESEGMEGFDPLEMDRYSQLQQLSRSLLESSSDLVDIKSTLADKSRDMETLLVQQSRINTELQEGLMRSRMVPFSRMVPRLRRIVRQVSGELHKKVDFYLENVEGELDRTVLERMVAPLEHMLRNAVDHGIESSEVREAAGKPPRGSVTLSLAREGGEIVITLEDDGGGIDLSAVRNKAIERGLMEKGADLSDHEVLQFITQAGFSTASHVTQISGRGVGMDVVHSEIKQLGGTMEIDSKLGEGTQFIVRLPFTVSVNRALMVNVGGDSYAIPLNTIEGIVRVSPFELEAYYQPDAPMFEYAGQPYLLRYMGALLHRGDRPNLEGQSMPLPVILVRGAEHSVAVQVDSLMGSREIVVKPLGPQFSMVHGLTGATVLGDGSVVVILDLLAMIRADASHMHKDFVLGNESAHEVDRNVLVMVVDDSVTVRKVTSRFLERQGMEVITAKDGVDAVTQLQEIERLPDVMLLDIEMPRMDGFEVASRVKHTSRLQDIPIIMITSRTGEKHRERALSIGVEEYMGKPYQETKLLETIHSLLGITV